jgi:hypothetical protein
MMVVVMVMVRVVRVVVMMMEKRSRGLSPRRSEHPRD